MHIIALYCKMIKVCETTDVVLDSTTYLVSRWLNNAYVHIVNTDICLIHLAGVPRNWRLVHTNRVKHRYDVSTHSFIMINSFRFIVLNNHHLITSNE